MTHVHYKFSSKLSYDTVVFDGPRVTLKDLKRQIMGREKLRAGDCDLQITNAQSKEEYIDDDSLISKGSSVIVRRIPIIGAKSSSSSKTHNIERSDIQPHHIFGAFKAMDDQNSSGVLPFFSKMANLADVDVSEEDKLKVMMNQSYDSMNYNKFGTALPANYTCYRCGNTGHHIRNCPTSGDKTFEAPLRIKKSSGIPRSFMVEVDDPNIKGAMLTNCGRYAIPSIDIEAYAIGKKEKPPFLPQEQLKSEDKEEPVPEELLCLICHDLLSDAVVIPCCGNSYCDDCIRTALLDSEEHVCPTCSQSDVSPDTLIGNKFLRQAVDNFKKERGYMKSLRGKCGTSQSQNPTQTPSPVPTPPLVAVQSQPQKPQLSTHSQQDPLLQRSQAADAPPSSQLCVAPPTATGPASSLNTPNTSLQPVKSHLEIPDKEDEEKTWNDSVAAAAPSVPVSPKDPADPPSQLIPLVNLTPVAEQPQTVSVNLQQPSSGPASIPSGTIKSWDSSSSSSGCPTGGWNESNAQQIPPSVSSSTAPPPLFPSPHFHPFLAAQQPLSSYPPGYPPTTPVWTLPNLQGAPIPSLCPSTPIPALIPKEWYRHQRKKERSPHRRSSRRSSSSRSNSKSSKSKSSRSYSRSSSRSRSRSRSRSQGRSRPHSPYSHHRDLHTRSHSSRSYSYGYKRSPTLSSSSSPRVGHHSRPRSPSDHRKNSHHSRHYNKRSASSSSSSRRRGEHYQRDTRGSRRSLASYPYAQHANQSSSQELDRERYLQWEREYKEWCDKYFSSYVGHFHQLPVPFLSLPPPQWGDREGSRNHASSDSRNQLQGRHTTRMGGHSPPSQSSSDSRSPPSRSSCDSRSTLSQSSSDSRSSPSHSSNNSRSPPSRSSSARHSTPSEDRAHPREYQQKCKEKYSCLSVTHTKGSKDVELQERSKDDKQPMMRSLENLANLKHEQKSMKKHGEGRGEESSSPDAVDSTDDCRKDERRHSTGPNTCKGGTPARNKATGSDALESVQPLATPGKRLDEDYERKKREQKDLEIEKERRRGNSSDSRQDLGRQHTEKPSKEADRMDADRYPGGSKASDWRSEKNRKRKGEDKDSSVRAESSKCLKTNTTEDPKRSKSESLNPFDRKKPKMEKIKEKKTWPLTERDIWEGGMKVKPQKKISININLEGKGKEEKTESVTGKTKESEKAGDGEVEKLNSRDTEIEANVKKASSRDLEEEKNKVDEGEARQKWERATFSDYKEGTMLQESAGEKKDIGEKREDRKKEDLDFALRAVEEEKKVSKKQLEERDRTEACKGEEVTNDERQSVRGGKEGQAMGELVAVIQKEKTEEDSTCKEDRGNPPGESKPKEELMEERKWRMKKEEEEDTMESQRSRNESHHNRPNTTVDDGSSSEDHQERKTVVKTLEEYTQDRAADREDELVLIQVPRSKWEKEESEEEERHERVIKVQPNALITFLPTPSASVTAEMTTNRETETEEKRERSVEMERGRDREREKSPILSTSHTSVAPSSGKDRSDSALCTDQEGEKGMKMERWRDRDRGSERDRRKESKRSKEKTREEEKGRDRERERGHSSIASAQKKNLPSSSSHSYSYSTSHDTERRDTDKKSSSCPGGKSSGGRSRESRAPEVPDQNTHKSYRDTLLYSKYKDKDHPHYYHNHQDPSGNYRPAGTRHSPLSEWKLRQVIKEGKGERGNEETVTEREGGSQRDDKADELDGQTKRRGMRELEEGERPSSRSNSVSSSASQENSGDDGRKERKRKQKKHKKEKRRGAPEMLEEGELKRHKHKKKTSKNSRDGKEEKSNEEVDDHTKLCSVMLS